MPTPLVTQSAHIQRRALLWRSGVRVAGASGSFHFLTFTLRASRFKLRRRYGMAQTVFIDDNNEMRVACIFSELTATLG
jgi:hypothetical protein